MLLKNENIQNKSSDLHGYMKVQQKCITNFLTICTKNIFLHEAAAFNIDVDHQPLLTQANKNKFCKKNFKPIYLGKS